VPTLAVRGLRLHYLALPESDPRAPALLFLHGSGGTHRHWIPQVRHFAPAYRAVALDLPGHGASEGDGAGSIADYRDWVEAFMDAAGMEQAFLVGHSMGGAIALAFALKVPGRLSGVGLVGTGARLRVHPSILEGLRGDPERAAALVSEWAYAPSSGAELPAQGRKELLRGSLAVLEKDFRACDAFDVMKEVDRIRVPAVVVCGAEDRLTPVKYGQYLHERIPGALLAVIPGAGHMVMLEKPDEVNRALAACLDRL
jgi:pimeloyl-ACP methyl ester carboxylesterase